MNEERKSYSLVQSDLERDSEVTFYVAGGPGGQHRNKTSTAVRVHHKPSGVVVTATERRSQHQNREAAFERLRERLKELMFRPKKRFKTKPKKSAKAKRLDGKKHRSQIKASRQGGNWD